MKGFMKLDSILAERNPNKFIDSLSDYITDPDIGGVSPEDLEQAPPMTRATIFVRAFQLATISGGIWKWFVELHDDYPKIDSFFRKIRANRSVAYLAAAKALFPKGRVPKDVDSRLEFCDRNGREFYQIDQQFNGAPEEAITKLRDYITDNQKTFQVEVEAFWKIRKANKRLFKTRLDRLRRKEFGQKKSKLNKKKRD